MVAQGQAFLHLIQNARFFPGHVPKITSLLRRKSRRQPVPFFFRLLHPEYRVENFSIAAAGPPAAGRGHWKKILAMLESFAGDLTRIARSYGVPANLLEIEVPDSADAARLLSLRTLTAGLRSAGAGISLGKWGNGTSSLALLGALDVDTVTIASELMATVPRDPRACVVTAALLDLLHALDVQVVVNGVETKAQLQWLSAWPQALVQGFLFSRPKVGLANVLALSRES